MVRLVRSGRTPAELAREFGCTAQAIRNWVKQEAEGDRKEDLGSLSAEEREELKRLRRENKQLRVEREILSKAAAWFARESDGASSKSTDS
jgi:transposase